MNFYNEDCLEGMKRLPDNSVDCILSDLPYNLTDCAWDKSAINLPAMWEQFRRILKPCCSAVLFASSKFTHKLIASNLDWYKYKWIWVKNAPTMFAHAKNAPMRKFEEILIFSAGAINHASCSTRRMKYNPQGLVSCENVRPVGDYLVNGELKSSQLSSPFKRSSKFVHNTDKVSDVSLQGGKLKGNSDRAYHCHSDWEHRGALKKFGNTVARRACHVDYYVQEQTGYPTDVLFFDVVPNNHRQHPTQKPVDLLEYLIRTYTNEGELVLDATRGSGSTGVAAINTGRDFIGFELDKNFYDIACKRLEEAQAKRVQSLFKDVVA